MDVLYKDESYRIMGACFEVYKDKGCGFVEPVYQECLSLELAMQSIPLAEQVELKLEYKGRPLQQRYKPDFICFDKIIVEIKAVSKLNDEHRAQVHNCLKATGHKLGLLVNFGHYPKVEWDRSCASASRKVMKVNNREKNEICESVIALTFFLFVINDVPLTALCRTIEIDLLQMMGETDVPPPIRCKQSEKNS